MWSGESSGKRWSEKAVNCLELTSSALSYERYLKVPPMPSSLHREVNIWLRGRLPWTGQLTPRIGVPQSDALEWRLPTAFSESPGLQDYGKLSVFEGHVLSFHSHPAPMMATLRVPIGQAARRSWRCCLVSRWCFPLLTDLDSSMQATTLPHTPHRARWR